MNHLLVDATFKEKRAHGSLLFPCSIYHTEQNGEIQVMLYKHWHEEAEILYVKEGKMEIVIEDKSIIVDKDSVLYIPPNSLHGAYRINKSACSFTSIVFHPTFIYSYTNDLIQQQYLSPLFQNKQVHVITKKDRKEKISFLVTEMATHYSRMNETSEIMIKGLLFQLLYYFIKSPPKSHPNPKHIELNIQRQKIILEYIENNYALPITLEELSSVLYLSKEQFCRFFKKNFRDTPISFLKKYRIYKSIDLLLTTEMKITDIAYEVGFDSSNYYTIAFKDVLHIGPRDFKKEYKQTRK